MITIKEIKEKDLKADICKSIIEELKDWFEIEEARNEYIEGSKDKIIEVGRS